MWKYCLNNRQSNKNGHVHCRSANPSAGKHLLRSSSNTTSSLLAHPNNISLLQTHLLSSISYSDVTWAVGLGLCNVHFEVRLVCALTQLMSLLAVTARSSKYIVWFYVTRVVLPKLTDAEVCNTHNRAWDLRKNPSEKWTINVHPQHSRTTDNNLAAECCNEQLVYKAAVLKGSQNDPRRAEMHKTLRSSPNGIWLLPYFVSIWATHNDTIPEPNERTWAGFICWQVSFRVNHICDLSCHVKSRFHQQLLSLFSHQWNAAFMPLFKLTNISNCHMQALNEHHEGSIRQIERKIYTWSQHIPAKWIASPKNVVNQHNFCLPSPSGHQDKLYWPGIFLSCL